MTEATTPATALVTGAARRIGRVIALDLARHGWAVAVHYGGSAAAARATVEAIIGEGGRAAAFQAELTDEAQVARLLPAAAAALGPVTLLVNNAAAFVNDGIGEAPRDIWDLHLETNLRAPTVLIRALAEQLPDGARGNVVNILDQRVWNPTPELMSYTVSKVGLYTLTRTLALALAPRIRVNGIGPGPTLKAARQSEEHFARQWRSVPLERRTTPEEVAAALRFILAAPALTGQMIALDGGEHLGYAQSEKPTGSYE